MREAKITPLYERLSRDDGDDKESNSISTQKTFWSNTQKTTVCLIQPILPMMGFPVLGSTAPASWL